MLVQDRTSTGTTPDKGTPVVRRVRKAHGTPSESAGPPKASREHAAETTREVSYMGFPCCDGRKW